jgi:K+-transporting ATPase ATPase B chain
MAQPIFSPFHPTFLLAAIYRGLQKLNPFTLYRNPVMFITEVGAIITTFEAILNFDFIEPNHLQICFWLWLTVIIANVADSMAEIRNEAKAHSFRQARSQILANRYDQNGNLNVVGYKDLKKGDLVLVRKDETIPGDGEIIPGSALIDESFMTGETQPVVRRAANGTHQVTAGTKVITDEIVIRITMNPGEGYLDKMIHLIESSKRKKTHNEIALTIFLSSITAIFLMVVVSFHLFANFYHVSLLITRQVALLISLIPITIASLLNAIGIAGINQLLKKNVIAMSGQAVEIAGDVDLILLDKTGTITYGRRTAIAFTPAFDVPIEEFMHACYLTSFLDQTYEGLSILSKVKERYPFLCIRPRSQYDFFSYNSQSRLSGIDIGEEKYRKGALDAIEQFLGKITPTDFMRVVQQAAKNGQTPLVVANQNQILGMISLNDEIKPGLSTQFQAFKRLGIKTVIVTGDNPTTAAAITKEVGADDYLASTSTEQKLHYLRQKQYEGHVVAITGRGVNDAPALAQADLGVAMNEGAQIAKEAANMIDLDSDSIKLFDIIQIGKQLLMTRGALTAFSIANDIGKYFVLFPSLLIPAFPGFQVYDFLNFPALKHAVLSTVIYNAISLVALIPLAFKGVPFIPSQAQVILKRNLIIYGVGGMICPFIGIKLIDILITNWV